MRSFGTAVLGAALIATSATQPLLAQEGDEAPSQEFIFQTEEEQAQAAFAKEMEDAFAIFGEIFAADPLTPQQEARLPLAREMALAVFPDGSFGIVMEETMAPMMDAIMRAATGDTRLMLGSLAGLRQEEWEALEEEAAADALAIFDPAYAARNQRISEIIVSMMGEMFAAIEPSYREGMARAFSTRFDESEMQDLLTFFSTETGGKFARHSVLVQYDPQMMTVMEQMGPAIAQVVPGMIADLSSLETDYAKPRSFDELSQAERERVSRLLGKPASELDSRVPPKQEGSEESADSGLT